MAAVNLSRDKARTVSQLSSYGTASLLSRDGHEVKVPLASLLGASTLVRSILAESRLHLGIHGPLVLSVAVAGDVLGSVADMLGVGESNVKEENIEKVVQVLDSLGVEANQSRIGKNFVYERTVTNEEDVDLVKVLGLVSDEASDLSEGDVNKAKDKLFGVESKLSQFRNNTEFVNNANYEDDLELEIELEPASDEETELGDCDVYEAEDNSLKGCYVKIDKIEELSDQCYRRNRSATDKTGMKCNICNYSTKYASTMKIHMRSHTGEKPYKCPICSYSCSYSNCLVTHIKTHTGVKPYKCSICNFCCKQASTLKRHNTTHTGEKPFKCKICQYSCSRAYHLTQHQRIHTGEKPYSCKICNKTFSQIANLIVHGKSHIGEKYTCKVCNKTFSQPGYLRKHGKIHIEEKIRV